MKNLFGCLIWILFIVLAFKTCNGCKEEPERRQRIEQETPTKKKHKTKRVQLEAEPESESEPEPVAEPDFSNDGDDEVQADESEIFDNTND